MPGVLNHMSALSRVLEYKESGNIEGNEGQPQKASTLT